MVLSPSAVDLELTISRQDGAYSLSLRLSRPDDQADVSRGPFPLATNFSVSQLISDPKDYGAALSDWFFAELAAREAFAEMRAASLDAGHRLYLRLRLPPELQSLRWETLLDPVSERPLVFEGNLLLSRYLSADDYQTVKLRPRTAMKSLVAIAAPIDAAEQGLAPIDAEAEAAQVRAALDGMQATTLGIPGTPPANWEALSAALRDGCDVLYLLAHGKLADQPWLYLTDAQGRTVQRAGQDLVNLLRSLGERRPRLVVPASCESAGSGDADTMAALGPLLLQAGVPVVLAMQGNISQATMARFAPVFFKELLRDGLADRALHAARLAVADRNDWWMPVLYSRLRAGPIWAQSASASAVPPGLSSPYRALNAFTIDDAHLFFGRDALIEEGYQSWLRSDRRFLAVVGASGSGKSSLAQAGLLPRFQRDLAELHLAANLINLRPGSQPLNALRDALRRGEYQVPSDFVVRLATEPALLLQILQQTVAEQPAGMTILLVDQFEELFTVCEDVEQRATFDAALSQAIEHGGEAIEHGGEAIEHGGKAISVLLTLRSDFFRHTAELQLRAHIAQHLLHVRTMNAQEMQVAITAPVRQVAGDGPPQFAEGLVPMMIKETGASPGALPLLEFTLSRLWQAGTLDLQTYQRIGGVSGALEQQAETVYGQLDPDEQQAMRHLLLQLVQLGEGSEDTRRQVTLADLTPAGQSVDQTADLVQRLAAERLLTTNTWPANGNHGESTALVEVSHEALIRGWNRLRIWLEEDRELLRLQRQIEDAAKLWRANHRDSSHLWIGSRLARAEEQRAALDRQMNADQQDFLVASRARERRNRFSAGAGALAAIGVLILAVLLGVILRQSAELEAAEAFANAQRLALQALDMHDSDPETGLLLAYEAAARISESPDPLFQQALRENLFRPELKRELAGHYGYVESAQFSHDGSMIVTGSEDGKARVFQLDGSIALTLTGHTDAISSAHFSPDNSTILTASNDNSARLWNLEGEEIQQFRGHSSDVRYAVFSPDGQRILTASFDGTAILWDLEGNQIQTFRVQAVDDDRNEVRRVEFSPDGKFVLLASYNDTAELWTVEGERIAVFEHDSDVIAARFHPGEQSNLILTAARDGTRIWQRDDPAQQAVLLEPPDEVWDAQFSPDGDFIATASKDGHIRIWSMDIAPSGDIKVDSWQTFKAHERSIPGIAFSSDGRWLLSASQDGQVKRWDVEQLLDANQSFEDPVKVYSGHTGRVWSVAYQPDGQGFVTSGADSTIRFWDANGTLDRTLPAHNGRRIWDVATDEQGRILTSSTDNTAQLRSVDGNLLAEFRHDGDVRRASFHPADPDKIVTASHDNTAVLWDISGIPDVEPTQIITISHTERVNSAVISPDGSMILTASDDNTARLSAIDGTFIREFQHRNNVYTAVFDKDGQKILTASLDGTARLWSLDGTHFLTLGDDDNDAGLSRASVTSAIFISDDELIVTTGTDNTAKVWNAITGALLHILPDHGDVVYDAAFYPSDNHRFIVTASGDGLARLWQLDVAPIPEVTTLGHDTWLTSAIYNNDGTHVLTAGGDTQAHLWTVSGDKLTVFSGHTNTIYTAVFSPDEQRILTASRDGTARVWNIDGTPVLTLTIPREAAQAEDDESILETEQTEDDESIRVYDAVYSPNGKLIATASDDNTARIWSADDGKLLNTIITTRSWRSTTSGRGA